MVRAGGHWSEKLVVATIGLLTLTALITDAQWPFVLAGVLFWVSLPTMLFGSTVRVGEGVIIEIGWPIRLFRVEISPEEIVEVVNLEEADKVPPVRYYRETLLFTFLWLAVGFTGLVRKPEWAFMWFGWIYWGLVPSVPLLFPGRSRALGAIVMVLLSTAVSLIERSYGLDTYLLYFLMGLMLALVYLIEPFRLKVLVLVTEKGTYFISYYYYDEVKAIVKELAELMSGDSNVPAS